MSIFLIYCIPCSLIGAFIATMIAAGAKTKRGKVISFIILTTVITAVCAGGFTLEHRADERNWNNGTCPWCNGEYHFVNASRYRNHTTYYYECDTCGDILELGRAMR